MFTPELKNGECQRRKAWFHKMTLLRLYNVHQDQKCFLYQNGDYELDWSSYKLLFSNFLLGRTIYGPGQLRNPPIFILVSFPSPHSKASGLGKLSSKCCTFPVNSIPNKDEALKNLKEQQNRRRY